MSLQEIRNSDLLPETWPLRNALSPADGFFLFVSDFKLSILYWGIVN